MRTLRFFVVVSALFVLGSASARLHAQVAAAEESALVMVMPMSGFITDDDARQLADAIRNMIMTEISSGTKIRTVERAKIDDIMKKQELSLTGTLTTEQVVRIGELLGAQYAVTGGLSIDKRNARLDLRLVDIETGEIPTTFKDMVPRDEVLSVVDRVATDFMGNIRVTRKVVLVENVPAAAALAFSRGLDYEKRNQKREAARMFEKALELFPQHPHARAALQRVN